MKKNIANIGVEMELFDTLNQMHHPANSFQHCQLAFDVDAWFNPGNSWQTKEGIFVCVTYIFEQPKGKMQWLQTL